MAPTEAHGVRRQMLASVFARLDIEQQGWIHPDCLSQLDHCAGWKADKNQRIIAKLRGRGRRLDGKVSADDLIKLWDEKLPHDQATFLALVQSFTEASSKQPQEPRATPNISASSHDLEGKLRALASCGDKLSRESRLAMLLQIWKRFDTDDTGSASRLLLKELGVRTGWARERNERMLDKLQGRGDRDKGMVGREDWLKTIEQKLPHDGEAFATVMQSFLDVSRRSLKRRGIAEPIERDGPCKPISCFTDLLHCSPVPSPSRPMHAANSPARATQFPVGSGPRGGRLWSPSSPKPRIRRQAAPSHGGPDSGLSLEAKIQAEHGTSVIIKPLNSRLSSSRREMLSHVFECFGTCVTHNAVSLEDLQLLGDPAALVGEQRGSWPIDRNQRLVTNLCSKTGWCNKDSFVKAYEAKLPHDPEAFDRVIEDFLEVAAWTQSAQQGSVSAHVVSIKAEVRTLQEQLRKERARTKLVQQMGARVICRWCCQLSSDWLSSLVTAWGRNAEQAGRERLLATKQQVREQWVTQVEDWQRKWGTVEPVVGVSNSRLRKNAAMEIQKPDARSGSLDISNSCGVLQPEIRIPSQQSSPGNHSSTETTPISSPVLSCQSHSQEHVGLSLTDTSLEHVVGLTQPNSSEVDTLESSPEPIQEEPTQAAADNDSPSVERGDGKELESDIGQEDHKEARDMVDELEELEHQLQQLRTFNQQHSSGAK